MGGRRRTNRCRLFTGLATLLFGCSGLFAQTTGEIAGVVTDASGSVLPGVTMEATSASLQGKRAAISGRDGVYRLPGLPYRVRATLSAFGPGEKTATVSLDSKATVNFRLEVMAIEEVLVSGEIPLVDVTSTTGGTNYVNKVIARLPVGRNYADIIRSQPGVNTDGGDTQGRSLALTIYGATSAENQWIVDGVNTTNVIKGIQGKAINNEFIQEVEVKTGGYQAEYGRALGGVINVITKSGGNEFHGDGFVYYDSFDWKAKQKVTVPDLIANAMRVADYRRTDFGADLGGCFLKDRLWFFGAYDRVETPAKVSRFLSSPLVPNTLEFPLDSTDSLYSGKLTWNVTTGTTLVGMVLSDPTTNSGAGYADPRQAFFEIRVISNPDPGTWETTRHIGGTDFSLSGTQLFGSSGLLALQGARHKDSYELIPVGPASLPSLQDFTCSGGAP
jgi:outer membrane receptor protein involved in Fe transport